MSVYCVVTTVGPKFLIIKTYQWVLNINSIYNLYKEWLSENYPLSEPVSVHYYRDIFNGNFSIAFEFPDSDTCIFCNKADIKKPILKINDDVDSAKEVIKKLETEKDVHLSRA